ncbi:oligosaccharide flippase family protein [Shewanella sp. MBTL60-112-B2]|uniref:oligosaccharide flippase family protein n=1 Tax=Shewanella sp. MBTL60-112-B2 TaxID=2815917 RepID=UPI001C8120C1|nr:oligosaccharide flippase family protein [Shewanella sp. MBTL60-112-B2]GIU40991.1 LPS biosynthesis protein [Shewanella sp. MBTL60-112-B2]
MQSTEKNIMWNFMGYVLPILITIIIIPFTIKLLGTENFGVLSLIWVIVGYSSFLDFGVGRALTHYISSNKFTEMQSYIPSAVKKVLTLLFCISLIVTLTIFFSIEYILSVFQNSSFINDSDLLLSSKIAIITAFFVVISSAVRGVLEGYEEFKYINLVRLFSGLSISLSPFIIYYFVPQLWLVILSFLFICMLEVVLYTIIVKVKLGNIKKRRSLTFGKLKVILSFGWWSNLTNIIGSPMAAAYLDKAIIASLLGATALTYYSVPFDVIARFLILPAMITSVLFPLFSKLKNQIDEVDRLTMQALEIMGYLIAPVFITVIILAKPLMHLWLGEISIFMFVTIQIFAVGKFAESLNFVLLAQIQALGRPDLTAKRHLLELPFYACGLYFAGKEFGLVGIAVVWSSWALIDLLILFCIRKKLTNIELPRSIRSGRLPLFYLSFFCIAYLSAAIFNDSNLALLLASTFILCAFYILGWKYYLDKNSREIMVVKFSQLIGRLKLKSM